MAAGDEILVLCCDGIWDVMSNEDAGEFIRHQVRRALAAAHAHESSRLAPTGSP